MAWPIGGEDQGHVTRCRAVIGHLGPGRQQAVQHALAGRGLDHAAAAAAGRAGQELRRQTWGHNIFYNYQIFL